MKYYAIITEFGYLKDTPFSYFISDSECEAECYAEYYQRKTGNWAEAREVSIDINEKELNK